MCGRYALRGPKTRKQGDKLAFRGEVIDYAPRFNIPPMQDLPVYCIDAERGPQLMLMRWGFVPAWSKMPGKGAPLNNARAETVSAAARISAPSGPDRSTGVPRRSSDAARWTARNARAGASGNSAGASSRNCDTHCPGPFIMAFPCWAYSCWPAIRTLQCGAAKAFGRG
jgi:hypothetical protein